MRKVIIGSDHVGYPLKEAVREYLGGLGLDVVDVGPYETETPVDYPVYAQKVARAVANGEAEFGVVACGTGLGVSIAANKVPGARVALCTDVYLAHQARAHNDANVLALGAWVVTPQRMTGILDEWLRTEFEIGRHVPRLNMLDRYFTEPSAGQQGLDVSGLEFAAALSIRKSVFGPLLFAGEFETGLQAMAEQGFHSVEISLRNVDDLPADELAGLLETYNLSVTAFATGQGCLHDGLCISSVDPTQHPRAVQRFKDITLLASRFGAGVIMGGVRGRLAGPPEERQAQRAVAVDAIRDCAQYAASLGVPFVIEPINHYETNFITHAAEGLALLDEIGVPSAKLLLDLYHMNLEEVDFYATFRQVGARLGYLHLADSNRQAPGLGHLDLRSLLGAVIRLGYRGVISAEILPLPDDYTALCQTRKFINSLSVPTGQLEAISSIQV